MLTLDKNILYFVNFYYNKIQNYLSITFIHCFLDSK